MEFPVDKKYYLSQAFTGLNNNNNFIFPISPDAGGINIEANNIVIAGATNSGKSTFLSTIIVSLLKQRGKNKIKFILIDPKRVDLRIFDKLISNLEYKTIFTVDESIDAFNKILNIINERESQLKLSAARNLQDYNINAKEKLANYFIIIDEFSDLMAGAKPFFEQAIPFIIDKGKTVGVNILLATSRPDPNNIYTPKILEKFAYKICFSVASPKDSTAIIGQTGGENLKGRGDMLFLDSSKNSNKPIRIQGYFISHEKTKKIIKKINIRDKFFVNSQYANEKIKNWVGLFIAALAWATIFFIKAENAKSFIAWLLLSYFCVGTGYMIGRTQVIKRIFEKGDIDNLLSEYHDNKKSEK